jgi:ABC-type branched-subunit amino acid transport system substrate-binding protein
MRVQRRHQTILGAGFAALSLLALAACGNGAGGADAAGNGSSSSGSSGGTYNIVLISDLSGDFSSVSAPGAAGAEVAVDNINASGGVNGKKLNLQVLDSQSSPSMALTAAQKAIAENPLALIMLSGSAGASAITSLVQSAHVPFLSPALTDTSVYPAQPYLYQPSLTAQQDAQAMYQFVKQHENGSLAGKVIDIAAINSPYVAVIVKDVGTLLKGSGGKVASVEQYDLPLASFATQADAIARDKPNVVLTFGSTDDTVVVSKALTAAGVGALQVGIPSGAGQATLQQIGSANYYGMTADPYPSELPSVLAIAGSYGKKAEMSGSIFSMSGWVAVYTLADALKLCGDSCSSTALNGALQRVSNYTVPDGVSYGPVTFSGSDHAAVSTVRFRSYDPASHQFTESSPINVGIGSGNG